MLTFHSWFLPTFHSPPPPPALWTSCQTWMNVEAGLFLSPPAHQCTDQEKTRLSARGSEQHSLLYRHTMRLSRNLSSPRGRGTRDEHKEHLRAVSSEQQFHKTVWDTEELATVSKVRCSQSFLLNPSYPRSFSFCTFSALIS